MKINQAVIFQTQLCNKILNRDDTVNPSTKATCQRLAIT